MRLPFVSASVARSANCDCRKRPPSSLGDSDGLLVATPAANHPAWLTGGSFGPDGSVLTALVGVLLTCSIVVAHRRWSR